MNTEELSAIFTPFLGESIAHLKSGTRLVHYTSAESACKIISNGEVWLRNSLLMNDFSEIEHGINCLTAGWNSPSGLKLREKLAKIEPDFVENFAKFFDSHLGGIRQATFMMSLSIHDDDEDQFGRLSMWRAYGGKSGVAIVMNPQIFISTTDELKVYSSPVRYLSIDQYVSDFELISNNIINNFDGIISLGKDMLFSWLFLTFRIHALCTKHPGSHEEKEWRIFHSPLLDGHSKWLRKENEIISGIPQEVIKIALEDDEDLGIVGMSPAKILNRVIIGPCQHPLPIYYALHNALEKCGTIPAQDHLHISYIPLRQ